MLRALTAGALQAAPGLRASMGPPPPPPLSDDHPAWADEVWASPLDVRRRIFCNRSLNMAQIRAVGFDMVGRLPHPTLSHFLPFSATRLPPQRVRARRDGWSEAGWRAMAHAVLQRGHGCRSARPSAAAPARLFWCARCAARMHAGQAPGPRAAPGARGAARPPGRS